VPMTWWLRGVGLLLLVPIGADLIWRSRPTHSLQGRYKWALMLSTLLVIGIIAYEILPSEYRKENPIARTAANGLTMAKADSPILKSVDPTSSANPQEKKTAIEVIRPATKVELSDDNRMKIVKTIVERYKEEHNGQSPTVGWINQHLQKDALDFRVSLPKERKEPCDENAAIANLGIGNKFQNNHIEVPEGGQAICDAGIDTQVSATQIVFVPAGQATAKKSQLPASGQRPIVDNEGTIEHTSIEKAHIGGVVPPGGVTILHVAPGAKAENLHIKDVEEIFLPNDPVPAPSAPLTLSSLSYKKRIANLERTIGEWEQQKESEIQPKDDDFWDRTMPEFHKKFGPQLIEIAQGLRNCGYQEVKHIYWREQIKPNKYGALQSALTNLETLEMRLPNDDSHLQCANQ